MSWTWFCFNILYLIITNFFCILSLIFFIWSWSLPRWWIIFCFAFTMLSMWMMTIVWIFWWITSWLWAWWMFGFLGFSFFSFRWTHFYYFIILIFFLFFFEWVIIIKTLVVHSCKIMRVSINQVLINNNMRYWLGRQIWMIMMIYRHWLEMRVINQ